MATSTEQAARILVVDDEVLVADSLKQMLVAFGHNVDTANSAPEALAMFDKEKFDLVLIDYVMPGMKGDELADILRSRASNLRIVVITASMEALHASGRSFGGVDLIISKPFQLQEFRDAIAKVLAKKSSEA